MKLQKAGITISVDRDGCTIDLHDMISWRCFATIKMDAKQFASALGRLSHTPCDITVITDAIDVLNKRMEVSKFDFQMPDGVAYGDRDRIASQLAQAELDDQMPGEGWVSDTYFGSQDSFFTRDGKLFAMATIRKWVEPDQVELNKAKEDEI